MARILGYIATSLDGFIASQGDKLDWLQRYEGMDLGEHDYNLFLKSIRTVVMGRGTYDFLAQDSGPWPYQHQCNDDVPPLLSSMTIWSPIPNAKEIGREEALFRRTYYWLPA